MDPQSPKKGAVEEEEKGEAIILKLSRHGDRYFLGGKKKGKKNIRNLYVIIYILIYFYTHDDGGKFGK